jgi:hypothetical protein
LSTSVFYVVIDNNGVRRVVVSTVPVLDLDRNERLVVFKDGSMLDLDTNEVNSRGATVRVVGRSDEEYIHPSVLLDSPPEGVEVTLINVSDNNCDYGDIPARDVTIGTVNSKYNVVINGGTGIQHGSGNIQTNYY